MSTTLTHIEKKKMLAPKLRFKGFSEEWQKRQLNDIVEKVNSGKTPLGGNSVYVDEGVLFIRSQNVLDSKLSYENSTFITKEVNDTMRNSVVKPNDILLNITGASLGRSCVVPKEFITGNVNQHVCIIRLTIKNDPYFFQPIFASEKGQKLFTSLQTGSGREGLNFQSIKKITLAFPTLPEQQKIASFLSAVDEKIQQLTRKKELLTEYKKGVMQQLFSGKLRFKDGSGKAFPKWEEKRLGDVSKVYDGTHQTPTYVNEGIPFYSVEHVTANQFSNTKYIAKEVFEKENEKVRLEKGDILMTKIGDIGTARLIDWDVKASFYVSLALLKQSKFILPKFLNQYIASRNFQLELWKRIIHVAFPKKINLGEIGNCKILVPDKEEQKKIADYLSNIDNKIEIVNKQITQNQIFKKGL